VTVVELLSLLVRPITAIIVGGAFVHGVRLLVDAAESHNRELFRYTTRVCSMIEEAIQATRSMTPKHTPRDEVALASERALVALLQSNGGFPGAKGDDTTRQMVREIRKMFAEVDRPTPEPELEPQTGNQTTDGMLHDHFALDSDELDDAEEIYGP
jgi:hypothetical protein